MKLWIVIYVLGEIGATVGPLEYSMERCQKLAVEEEAAIPESFTNYTADLRRVRKADIAYRCVMSKERPGVDSKNKDEWMRLE